MHVAPLPADESERIEALRRLGILDTPPEERYDRLVRIAAASLNTPIALISIVDEHRQWFKARVGVDADETTRDWAFCAHAIIGTEPGPFVVHDATLDDRFADNPLVVGDPNIRFYAGEIVRDADGWPMGTVCAIDQVPREFGDEDRQILYDIARLVEFEFGRIERDEKIAEIERSERQKTLLLDSLSEGLIVQNVDGEIVEWNRAAGELLGLSDDELAGRTSFDPRWQSVHVDGSLWSGDDHPAMEAIRTGQHVAGRTMGVHRPDGSLIWLDVNSQPIKDRDGTTNGSLTLFGNIAADFDAARASETMALRLRQAVDSSGIGTALLDASGSTTFVNDAYAKIVGRSHAELLGCPPSAWIHADDPAFGCGDDAELRYATATHELRLADRPGAATWVRAHVARLDDTGDDHDDDGDRFIIQLEDITDRRELQDALHASERVARASLESLEQGVIVADTTGAIQQANSAAVEILGYTAEQLTEEFRSGLWVTYDERGNVLPKEQRPIRQVLTTGEPVQRALVGWRRRTGELVLLRLSCTPVRTDTDGIFQFVVAFADVTEQHRATQLLDATFATAPVGLAVVDGSRSVVRCNSTFAAHTGIPLDLVAGRNIAALLGGEIDTAQPEQPIDVVADERLIDHGDADDVWVSPRSAHIDDLDQPHDIVATFDVTERKRLEQDLQRFRHLFRHANDIITVVDQTGQVMYASPSNERVLGYPEGWRSPGGVLDLVHPEDLAAAACRFAELLNGERGEEPFTMRLRTHDGEWRSIETVGTNLLDEPSVTGIVLTSRDVTERQLLTRELAYRATHDALTDLPNRSAAEERMESALARARREGRHVGVCFLDLDKFKAVNDTLGHAAGDAALIEIAKRLTDVVRETDLPARLGGDEFLVVLDLVSNEDEAAYVARRIQHCLANPPVVIGNLEVGVSLGLAISQHGDTASTLLSRADAALYRAKAAGPSAISLNETPA